MGGVARAQVQPIEDVLRGKETDRGVAAKDNRLVGIIVNNAGDRRDTRKRQNAVVLAHWPWSIHEAPIVSRARRLAAWMGLGR